MVRVEFLKQNDNGTVFYNCFPENKDQDKFVLGLDIENEKTVYNSLEDIDSYVIHAAYKVFSIYKETGKLPQKAISMWV